MTILFLLIALLAIGSVFAAGVPRGTRAGARISAADVARRDAGLPGFRMLCLAIFGIAAVAAFGDVATTWIALALGAGVALQSALDRWQRTNGSGSPHQTLAASLRKASRKAPSGREERKKLKKATDRIDAKLLATIRGAAGDSDADRIGRIADLLAERALRTDRAGKPIWLAADAPAVAENDALLALGRAHEKTRAAVL